MTATCTLIKTHLRSGSFRDSLDIDNTPVQVVTCDDAHCLTAHWFDNLGCARKQFPNLDPYNHTAEFTWSMRGEAKDGRTALRFESWPTYKICSA